jgi:hypothetical protein
MGLLIRLLNASPKAARAFRDISFGIWAWIAMVVGDVNLERFQNWLWGTPQEQRQILQQLQPLSKEEEALLVEFQQHMDTQYQVQLLKRYVLTLPSLPTEGF